MNEDRAAQYLAEALALDPAEHAGRILELREQYHSGAAEAPQGARRPPAAKAKTPASRASLEGAVDELRDQFYELDPGAAAARLKALELHDHPDLDRVRKRLARVNDLRPQLEELAKDEDADSAYVSILRRVLVLPGPEAAALRDRTARSAGAGMRAKDAKKFAALLNRRYPELAELEEEWLQRMRHSKRDAKDSMAVKGGLGFFGGYLIFRLILFIVRQFTDAGD